jgi:hypothetical protein
MSKRLSQLTLVPRRNPQLHCVNEKIAGLAGVKPWCDPYAAFSLAAHLATEAIEATEELRQMPGVEVRAFQPAADFWHRVRDFNHAAALACAGGNQTLAEALVTFRFLNNCGGDQ